MKQFTCSITAQRLEERDVFKSRIFYWKLLDLKTVFDFFIRLITKQTFCFVIAL